MAEIRLNKLMRHFNVGLTDLVDFLRSQGVIIDENPCAKVSDRYLPALKKNLVRIMVVNCWLKRKKNLLILPYSTKKL